MISFNRKSLISFESKRGPEKGNLPFPGKLSFTEVEKILLMKSLIYLLPPKQLNQRRI